MSTVILDTITGKSTATTITIGSTPVVSSSANSMTIRGEGSAQTSIQQGLAKAWFTCDNMALLDAFNSGGLVDNGDGDLTLSLTTHMANNDYSCGMSAGGSALTDSSTRIVEGIDATTARTSSTIRLRQGYKTSSLTKEDASLCAIQFFGDLA